MNTLAIAFGLTFAAVSAYLSWLQTRHNRLEDRLASMESTRGQSPASGPRGGRTAPLDPATPWPARSRVA